MNDSIEMIIVNYSNYVSEGVYEYKFSGSQRSFPKGSYLQLHSFSTYNSTYNISSVLKNNTFTINWLGTNYPGTIPDGYYSDTDLTAYLAYFCASNKLYFVNSSQNGGGNVFPFTISANTVLNVFQFTILYIPTAVQAATLGYTKPSGATWNFPVTAVIPTITLATKLNRLLGFTTESYPQFPPSPQSTTWSKASDIFPIISPVFSYLLACDQVRSGPGVVNTIFYQQPINASFGKLIESGNLNSVRVPLQQLNGCTSLVFRLYDQDLNPLSLQDPEICLHCSIVYPGA